MPQPAVYILASYKNGTLYVGHTGDLKRRVWEHKQGLDKFTREHAVKKLVYYELFDNFVDAMQREKQLKKWRREWKVALIEKNNPEWRDFVRGDYLTSPFPLTVQKDSYPRTRRHFAAEIRGPCWLERRYFVVVDGSTVAH